MRFLVAMLLVVATGATAKDRPAPVYDCSIEVTEGQDHWNADEYGVRWFRFHNGQDYVAASLNLYSRADRAALQRYGAFDPALGISLVFGPPDPKSKKPVWLALFSGQANLAPVLLSKDKGRYILASVLLFDLEPLLAAGPDLRMVYVSGDGTQLYQSSIPVADIRSAIERFPALARDYEARVAKPEGVCRSDGDMIIVT